MTGLADCHLQNPVLDNYTLNEIRTRARNFYSVLLFAVAYVCTIKR